MSEQDIIQLLSELIKVMKQVELRIAQLLKRLPVEPTLNKETGWYERKQ